MDATDEDQNWPTRKRAYIALALLMIGAVFSLIDRAVISLLVEPIKTSFDLSDTQFGALQSLAFGLFYIFAPIPLGVLSDRYQRRLVVAGGMVLFNAFAIMTGLAHTYAQLFVARVGVGFGEASLVPAAFSLIADYFPPRLLGRAMSLFTASNTLGGAIAMIFGGKLIGHFDQLYATNHEVLFGLQPWQATLVALALPGMLLSPLYLVLLREPRRQGVKQGQGAMPLRQVLRELGTRRRVLALLIGGAAMVSLQVQAMGIWIPSFFIRVFHWKPSEIGAVIGAMLIVGGMTGQYLGGWLTDWTTARGRADGPVLVAALTFSIAMACGVAAPLMPGAWLSLALFLPVFLFGPITFGVVPTALQMITPNQLRARVSGIFLTATSVVGVGVGPILVGFLTDHLFGTPEGVRYSIALLAALTGPPMMLFMLLARRPYRQLRAVAS